MSTLHQMPSRRRFLRASTLGGSGLLICPLTCRGEAEIVPRVFDERVGYCCGECTPEKCPFLSTSMEVKKRKAAELKQKLGREITPEQITCSRCRVDDRSAAQSIRSCPVRKCVVGRKLVSCAHCAELPTCKRANPVTRDRALAIRRELLARPGAGAG